MKRDKLVAAILGICVLLLHGCGGGHGNAVKPTTQTGGAQFVVQWPDKSRLVPITSQSIKIDITANGKLLQTGTVNRPNTGATFLSLPVGDLVATAGAYPQAGAVGTMQAVGTVPLPIQAGQTTSVTLTMSSTVASMDVTPVGPAILARQTLQLVATAKDDQGRVVLVDRFSWESSDPHVATVDSNGLVTSLASGNVQITVRDTGSQKVGQTTVKVTTPAYRLYGLAFSPYRDLPPGADPVTPERISQLLNIAAPYTDRVYLFGTGNGLDAAPALAKARGLKVMCTCWLESDLTKNRQEVDRLKALIRQGYVDVAVVGSEVLLRGQLTEDQLIAYIQEVRSMGVRTAYADVYNMLLDHPRVIAECDLLMANIYPFHENIPIERAARALHWRYEQIKQAASGKEVLVGETGWQSAGASASTPQNAADFFLQAVSWARTKNVGFFWFEAFDEPWKSATSQAHFGIWDANHNMKPGMEKVFNNQVAADTWTPTSPPRLNILQVPPYGDQQGVLTGLVDGMIPYPFDYGVSVYVEVTPPDGDGWYPKPTYTSPLAVLGSDGYWSIVTKTGGHDENATRMVVLLFPKDYAPTGGWTRYIPNGPFPEDIWNAAVARKVITRTPEGQIGFEDTRPL